MLYTNISICWLSNFYALQGSAVDYTRADIAEKADTLESEDVGQVLLGSVISETRATSLYIVLSEDVVSQRLVNYLNLFPDTNFSFWLVLGLWSRFGSCPATQTTAQL